MRVQGYERDKQNQGEAKMSKVTADQKKFIASSIYRLNEIGEMDESRGMRIVRALVVNSSLLTELGMDYHRAMEVEDAMIKAMEIKDQK